MTEKEVFKRKEKPDGGSEMDTADTNALVRVRI